MAKKHLLENSTPHSCGGGTVFFVSVVSHSIFSVPLKKASLFWWRGWGKSHFFYAVNFFLLWLELCYDFSVCEVRRDAVWMYLL